jgi:hypothetical protein
MSCHLESLESRTLFAVSVDPQLQFDYNAAYDETKAVKNAATAAFDTYRADAKAIAADVRGLGKSKANTAAVTAVNKAIAAAVGADTRDEAKLVAAGQGDLKKAKSAFGVDLQAPTARNLAKLNAALATLSTALAPLEAKLSIDVGTGDTAVDGPLDVLEGANPTAAALTTRVTGAEDDQSAAAEGIAGSVDTLNTDIGTLLADVSS